jgi:hypothetical protein
LYACKTKVDTPIVDTIPYVDPFDMVIPLEASIEIIDHTCLIVIPPIEIEFDDMDSLEAIAYHTTVDDWYWYMSEMIGRFLELDILVYSVNERVITFFIENGENISIDTTQPLTDLPSSVLLYRTGHTPMYIDAMAIEDDMESILLFLDL